MNIEIKNVRINERMSEETICFDADLYINGIKAGNAYNYGHGGPTSVSPKNDAGGQLIKEADDWCKKLPPRTYNDIVVDDKPLVVSMNLENFVDDLLVQIMAQRDLVKFHKQMEKDMTKGILVGIPYKEYKIYKVKHYSLQDILKLPNATSGLERMIKEKIYPLMTEDEKILNTNLPTELLSKLNISIANQRIEQKQQQEKKNHRKSARHKNQ